MDEMVAVNITKNSAAEEEKVILSLERESTQEPVHASQAPISPRIKLDLKRKRFEFNIELSRKRSFSPAIKKRRLYEEGRSPLKWRYHQISVSSKSDSETCPPESKRIKLNRDESAVTPSTSKVASSNVVILKPRNDRLPSKSTQRENRRKQDKRVTKVWIIGSSYIKRGELAARQQFGVNFGLDAKVEWFGKGGMRWNGVLPRFYEELSTQSAPDVLVIHAGGNDLGITPVQQLSSTMKKELMQLHADFPSMKIALSSINERQAWRYGNPRWIDNDRKMVNFSMRKAADSFDGVIIEHPGLKYYNNHIFVPDGVHFTKRGNKLFLMSIQSTIKKILQKINFN